MMPITTKVCLLCIWEICLQHVSFQRDNLRIIRTSKEQRITGLWVVCINTISFLQLIILYWKIIWGAHRCCLWLYISLIKPILSYGSVTWTLTQTTEQMLNTFERKILQRIYGPIQEGDAGVPDGIMNCTPYITI